MYGLVISLLLASVHHAVVADNNPDSYRRIINGELAVLGQFPWQAGIHAVMNGKPWFCGGALISNQHVLTAAHCIDGASLFEVILGTTKSYDPQEGKISLSVRSTSIHELWDKSTWNNDVALLTLNETVSFSKRIHNIRLAGAGENLDAGITVTLSGWGKTNDDYSTTAVPDLHYVQMKTITNEQCLRVFKRQVIQDYVVCCDGTDGIGPKSPCQGDSGGALVRYNGDVATHVGISSFSNELGCALKYPSAYMRTDHFSEWIQKKMK